MKIVLGDSPFSVVQRRRGNWWKGHSIVSVFRFFLAKRVECKIGFNSFQSPYPAFLAGKAQGMQEVDDIVSQEAYHHAGLILAEAGAVRLVQEEAVLFHLDVVLHRPPLLVGLEYPFRRHGLREVGDDILVAEAKLPRASQAVYTFPGRSSALRKSPVSPSKATSGW